MAFFRTFVAVEVNAEVRARAERLIGKLKAGQAKVNWTRPENLHLTLQFLGDTPDTKIPEVCRAVADAAGAAVPFSMTLKAAGAFPRPERPRTVWVGVEEGSDQLRALQADIEGRLLDLGFPRERRRYTPHLTIGRVREGGAAQAMLAELLQQHAKFAGGSTRVDQVLVMASFLDSDGPTYQVLGRANLG